MDTSAHILLFDLDGTLLRSDKTISARFPGYDMARFSDGDWYKFTKKSATKENAIARLLAHCNLTAENLIAFGDDFADIGMLKMAGTGIAMGNAIPEVKQIADVVIGSNNADGIADWLKEKFA